MDAAIQERTSNTATRCVCCVCAGGVGVCLLFKLQICIKFQCIWVSGFFMIVFKSIVLGHKHWILRTGIFMGWKSAGIKSNEQMKQRKCLAMQISIFFAFMQTSENLLGLRYFSVWVQNMTTVPLNWSTLDANSKRGWSWEVLEVAALYVVRAINTGRTYQRPPL